MYNNLNITGTFYQQGKNNAAMQIEVTQLIQKQLPQFTISKNLLKMKLPIYSPRNGQQFIEILLFICKIIVITIFWIF